MNMGLANVTVTYNYQTMQVRQHFESIFMLNIVVRGSRMGAFHFFNVNLIYFLLYWSSLSRKGAEYVAPGCSGVQWYFVWNVEARFGTQTNMQQTPSLFVLLPS